MIILLLESEPCMYLYICVSVHVHTPRRSTPNLGWMIGGGGTLASIPEGLYAIYFNTESLFVRHNANLRLYPH